MKILVLTSIYPGNDIPQGFTPIVHYFAREWVKMGHSVVVVHNVAYYPCIFYIASQLFNNMLSSITGTTIPTIRYSKEKHYTIDSVPIYRMPMFKAKPHAHFTKSSYKRQEGKILALIETLNFKPDIIIGHWSNPQLKLLSGLKKITGSRTCMVMHDDGSTISSIFHEEYNDLINDIDVWGFRSRAIKESFIAQYPIKNRSFLCYSGIPVQYVRDEITEKEFTSCLKTFAFVGQLIKRKYPVVLIDSLLKVYKDKSFNIKYIGQGAELKRINNRIRKYGLYNKVDHYEKLDRDVVQKILSSVDCFIMVSKNEAYGLVYLEAMAAGCITVASKNEGFDGIIEHGINGFLCDAGNLKKLATLIEEINKLSVEEKKCISKNAQLTAQKMSDSACAERYIDNVI